MELTQQLRDFAAERGVSEAEAVEAGMQEKSAEFQKQREIYVATD